MELEETFKNFITNYNIYIEGYFCDIAKVNDDFMKFEIDRRENLKDSIMKFLGITIKTKKFQKNIFN
jgi:hypothetical protein